MKGKLFFFCFTWYWLCNTGHLSLPQKNAKKKVAEKVRYSTGRGSVKLGQNAAYEGAEYEDEEVYEVPT